MYKHFEIDRIFNYCFLSPFLFFVSFYCWWCLIEIDSPIHVLSFPLCILRGEVVFFWMWQFQNCILHFISPIYYCVGILFDGRIHYHNMNIQRECLFKLRKWFRWEYKHCFSTKMLTSLTWIVNSGKFNYNVHDKVEKLAYYNVRCESVILI